MAAPRDFSTELLPSLMAPGLSCSSQVQGLVFAFVELHKVPVGLFPQPPWGPLGGSSAQDCVGCLLEEKWSGTTARAKLV